MRLAVALFVVSLSAGLSPPVHSAGFPPGTSTQPLFMVHSQQSAPASGDFISADNGGGLNTYYSYFIEVVPGLTSLQVEIYDPDIRQGPDAEEQPSGNNVIRDQTRATGMQMQFSLRNPSGAVTTGPLTANATTPAVSHATWWTFANIASPAAGHWELRADSLAGGGANVAGYGVRARGFNGAVEVDLNVYIHSYLGYQLHAPGFRDYLVYPFVTGHCQLRVRDFDNDDNASNPSFINIASSQPTVASQVIDTLSGNGGWATNDTTRATFFSDIDVRRPGIWSATIAPRGIGTGTTNEGQFYFASPLDVGGTSPPTAQPQGNSWRIYLPMLDGSVPVKPNLYQRLFHESGPNPPQVGQPTFFRVSIRMENPTNRPIVFSTPSNIVSAQVPGGQVVYVGSSASVDQGTIVSQPANLGSGPITWNPGTLVAGGEADLSYLVRVTPTSSGRVVVTGTPTANGTRAQYVDETGVTTPGRSTYLWGPLCELAANTTGPAVPAPATLSKLSAQRRADGLVDINWVSGVEVGVVAWRVQAEAATDAPALSGGRALGQGDALHGHAYRLDGVVLPQDRFYLVTEEADGQRQVHGPFVVDQSVGSDSAPVEIPWGPISADVETARQLREQRVAGAGGPVNLLVRSRGVQSVAHSALTTMAADFDGLPVDQIALLRDGQPWPRRIISADGLFGVGDRVEFVVAEQPGGIYVDYSVYQLVIDAARVVPILDAEPVAGEPTVLTQIQRRAELASQTGYGFSSPLVDPFYMARLNANQGSPNGRNFVLATPARLNGDAILEGLLWGGLDYPDIADEHGYAVSINGQPLGAGSYGGLSAEGFSFDVPAAALNADSQTLRVQLTADLAPTDVQYVESLALRYPAAPQVDGQIDFVPSPVINDDPNLPPSERIFAAGFDDDIAAFDCAAAGGGESLCWSLQLQGLDSDGSVYRVDGSAQVQRLVADAGMLRDRRVPDARVFVANPADSHSPELRLQTADPAVADGADYLLIAHPDFVDGVAPLLALRQSQGLSTQLVSTEAVYARTGGQPDAASIRSFIAEALAAGTSYVVLVGGDSYDSAGYLNSGSVGFIPTPYTRLHPVVNYGASDSLYADVDGDNAPDVALGRLPVRTTAELTRVVDKILAMDGLIGDRALFLADDVDPSGFNFDAAQQELGAELGVGWSNIFGSMDTATAAQLGTLAQSELQAGLGMVHFFGHSSPTAWTSPAPGILPPAQIFAGALADAAHPTLLVQWGCWNSYHVDPSYNTIGHAWLLAEGGAGAVIGAAAITDSAHDYYLSQRLLQRLEQYERLGDAFNAAKRDLAAGDPGLVDVLLGTTLLGDPATRLR